LWLGYTLCAEVGKLVERVSFVRRVEQVRAVAVHLDPGRLLGLAVGVATDVVAAVDQRHLQPEIVGCAFGDGQAEKPRADDDEVCCHLKCPLAGVGGRTSLALAFPTVAGTRP